MCLWGQQNVIPKPCGRNVKRGMSKSCDESLVTVKFKSPWGCLAAQYADWCAGGDKDSFYTNSYCQQIYQNHVKTLVNRQALPPR